MTFDLPPDADVLTLSPYDLALDLHGYPPKQPVTCDRCGDREVEPYHGNTCWFCWAARMAFNAYDSGRRN